MLPQLACMHAMVTLVLVGVGVLGKDLQNMYS